MTHIISIYDTYIIKKFGGEKHMREENGKLIFEFQEAIAEILPPNFLINAS